jgi:hypothetical protein
MTSEDDKLRRDREFDDRLRKHTEELKKIVDTLSSAGRRQFEKDLDRRLDELKNRKE